LRSGNEEDFHGVKILLIMLSKPTRWKVFMQAVTITGTLL